MLIAHAIPRAASDDTELPIFSIFTRWLSGFNELHQALRQAAHSNSLAWHRLEQQSMSDEAHGAHQAPSSPCASGGLSMACSSCA